ncbi:MAG: hypothetical protein QW220_04320 [Candidatus Bathyarchaeia archaeon]
MAPEEVTYSVILFCHVSMSRHEGSEDGKLALVGVYVSLSTSILHGVVGASCIYRVLRTSTKHTCPVDCVSRLDLGLSWAYDLLHLGIFSYGEEPPSPTLNRGEDWNSILFLWAAPMTMTMTMTMTP